MKKSLSITLAAALTLSLAVYGGYAADADSGNGARKNYLTFKVGTNHNSESFFAKGLMEFKRLIEQNTKGAVQVEVFTDEALGTEGEMAEGVAMGTVDACLIGASSVGKLDSTFNVFNLPYLFENYAHVDAVFAGEPGERIRKTVWDTHHVMLLDYWESGFRHYSTNTREIKGPQDMAGQLIRIPDNPIQAATAAALGASTSTLGYKEVYLACSNGTVDGQEGPVFAFVDDNFYEVQRYMILDGHIYTAMGLMMNGDVWDQLTDDDKKIVMQAAKDAGVVEKNGIRQSEAEQVKFLKSKGMIVNEKPNKDDWRKATAGVYEQFKDVYGADLIDMIRNYKY